MVTLEGADSLARGDSDEANNNKLRPKGHLILDAY